MKDTLDRHRRSAYHRKYIVGACKKMKRCPYCDSANKQLTKMMGLKMVHEVTKKEDGVYRSMLLDEFNVARRSNPDLGNHVSKVQDDLTPLRVKWIFERVPDADCYFLNLNPEIGRPEDMLITELIVPPVCIR